MNVATDDTRHFRTTSRFSAGGKCQKKSAPSTTAASPEYSLLRRTFSRRSWSRWHSLYSDEHPAHRSWQFPPVRVLPPEDILPKDHHLQPRRLRRSSAARRVSSSGEHSLSGVEVPGAVCLPTSAPLVGARRLGRQPAQVIRSSANFFMTLLVRLFFLDYFSQNGNHGGRIRYKFTGSAQNPKDAVQIRFAAWERKGAVFKEGTSQLR